MNTCKLEPTVEGFARYMAEIDGLIIDYQPYCASCGREPTVTAWELDDEITMEFYEEADALEWLSERYNTAFIIEEPLDMGCDA